MSKYIEYQPTFYRANEVRKTLRIAENCPVLAEVMMQDAAGRNPMNAGEIANRLSASMDRKKVSRLLNIYAEHGILKQETKGKYVLYSPTFRVFDTGPENDWLQILSNRKKVQIIDKVVENPGWTNSDFAKHFGIEASTTTTLFKGICSVKALRKVTEGREVRYRVNELQMQTYYELAKRLI